MRGGAGGASRRRPRRSHGVSAGSARQHGGEHLPGQEGFGGQAEDDVGLLAEQIVTPFAHLLVLQPMLMAKTLKKMNKLMMMP